MKSDLINREIQQKTQQYNKLKQMVITPETTLYEQFLRDAFLIHRYGLEQFVSICMGESGRGGWGYHKGTDQVKFSQMTSCKKYFQLKATYEQLKIKRNKERNKTRISGKTTLLADVFIKASTSILAWAISFSYSFPCKSPVPNT